MLQRSLPSMVVLALVVATAACHPPIKVATPTVVGADLDAALWRAPDGERDLFAGIGGAALAPDPQDKFSVIAVKQGGFSRGYTVMDSRGREWSAKFPPEAQTEVVSSRLLWGLGFHQVPIYLLDKWTATSAKDPNPQRPARFRAHELSIDGASLKEAGPWSYYQNPFVGSRPLAGLIVLQVMLGNSDLKDEQNMLYELSRPLEGARVWYVARDLGHTFGRSGLLDAPRNDIDVFEKTPFIKEVKDGLVKFHFSGRHGALVDTVTPADVKWICTRLRGLSDKQWQDAFRAGGYQPELAARFIARMKQKIAEGLALTQ